MKNIAINHRLRCGQRTVSANTSGTDAILATFGTSRRPSCSSLRPASFSSIQDYNRGAAGAAQRARTACRAHLRPAYHPAEGCQQYLDRPPADLSHEALVQAVDELHVMYDMPLVAPRAFQSVASHRARFLTTADPTSASGVARPASAAVAPAARGIAASTVVPGIRAGADAAVTAATAPAAGAPRELEAGRDLSSEPSGQGTGVVHGAVHEAGAVSVFLAVDDAHHLHDHHHRHRRTPAWLRTAMLAAAATASSNSGQGGGPPLASLAPAVGDGAIFSRPDSGRSSVASHETGWKGDPGQLYGMPADRLGRLLIVCARRRVPLRLSALQAYVDAVSHRAAELEADDLVSSLEGLSSYSFRSAAAIATATSTGDGITSSITSITSSSSSRGNIRSGAAAGRSARGGTRLQNLPAEAPGGSGSRSGSKSGGPSSWAAPILSALLDPVSALDRTSCGSVAVTGKDSDAGGSDGAGVLRPSGGRNLLGARSGSGGVEHRRPLDTAPTDVKPKADADAAAGPVSIRQAAAKASGLKPGRAIQLVHLLAQLEVRPPPGWTVAFLDSTAQLVPYMSGGQLREMLAVLLALGSPVVSSRWWAAVLDVWAPPPRSAMSPPKRAAGGRSISEGRGRASSGDGGFIANAPAAQPVSSWDNAALELPAKRSGADADGELLTAHDVRCAVLYYASRLVMGRYDSSAFGNDDKYEMAAQRDGTASDDYVVRSQPPTTPRWLPQGRGAPGDTRTSVSLRAALQRRIGPWALDSLYDTARTVLPYVTAEAHEDDDEDTDVEVDRGVVPTRTVSVQSRTYSGRQSDRSPAKGLKAGSTAVQQPVKDNSAPWQELDGEGPRQPPQSPQLPSPSALAMALVALPVVVRNATAWISNPAGPGGAVLSVLVAALQPQLASLPSQTLLELLQAFSSGRIHPGPLFLRRHAVALKRRAARLPPRDLLRAAGRYRNMGLIPSGGLRVAVRAARERVQLEEARRAAAAARRLRRTRPDQAVWRDDSRRGGP